MNFNDFPSVMSIVAFIVGISFVFANDYLAASVWLCYSLATFLVNKIGSSNLANLNRPDVILAWVTVIGFFSLVLIQLHRDFVTR